MISNIGADKIMNEENHTINLKGGVVLTNKTKNSAFAINTFILRPGMSLVFGTSILDDVYVRKLIAQGKIEVAYLVESIKKVVYNRKLKVLFFVNTLFRGGAETVTRDIVKGLYERGVDVYVLNVYSGSSVTDCMLENDISKFCVKLFSCYLPETELCSKTTQNIIMSLYRTILPDILIYNCSPVLIEPFVRSAHPPILQLLHSSLAFEFDRFVCGIDGVIAVSNTVKNDLLKYNKNIGDKNVFIIQNGIDVDRIDNGVSLRQKLGISNDGIVICFIGNLNLLKRPLFALNGFLRCRNEKSYILFAGNPNEQGNQVRQIIANNNIGKYAYVLGFVDNVKDVLATSDIIVNCSTSEGLPLSLMEAMYYGLPIIATNVGGNSTLVRHGQNGFLYDVDDFDTFCFYLSELINKPMLRNSFGAVSRQLFASFYTSERMVNDYINLFTHFYITYEPPVCSIVLPVYNGEATIEEAIRSIQRQTLSNFECIIVDDGSTDNTKEAVLSCIEDDVRFNFVSQSHGGVVKALNYGIRLAKTGLIARMDADDIMVETRLEKQVKFMEEYNDIDILGAQMYVMTNDGTVVSKSNYPLDHDAIIKEMYHRNPIGHPAVMMRRRIFDVVSYSDAYFAEDFALWIDCVFAGFRFANLTDVLLFYRMSHLVDDTYFKKQEAAKEALIKKLRERRPL